METSPSRTTSGRPTFERARFAGRTDRVVDGALAFIDAAKAADQPFFLNLWPDDVHSPFFPPEEKREATDGSKRALYLAVLEAMDEQLAPLFDRIREDPALRDNTLVIIASDNGHEGGAGSGGPLRGSKAGLYEGGIRSPLIVWGPGLVASEAAGTVNTSSILSAIDLNRSLYALADVPLPEGVKLDGENLVGTLLGKERKSRQSPLFWRRPPDRPGRPNAPNPDLAVRDGKWKLLMRYDGGDPRLYDLESDLGETRNHSKEQPEIVERLRQLVFTWNAEMPPDAASAAMVQAR